MEIMKLGMDKDMREAGTRVSILSEPVCSKRDGMADDDTAHE